MIKGIIFDMDGVVIDSIDCDFSAWKRMFSEAGEKFSMKIYKDFSGTKGNEIVKKYFKGIKSDEMAESLNQKKEDYFIEGAGKGGVSMIKGFKPFLESVKERGIKVVVATAADKRKVDMILGHLGLVSEFDAIVSSDQVKKGKPDPETFLKAVEKLGLNPEDCIVIEDAPMGLRAAKNGNIKCIAITTTHKREELGAADMVIDSFDELTEDVLKGI